MFTSYLESAVTEAAIEIGIHSSVWDEFLSLLHKLKQHNESMYAHSLRVGLYSLGISKIETHNDLHFPLMAGCGHDIGKCNIDNAILDKTTPLTDEEFAIIHRHPFDGYEMLKDRFPYAAMVAGLHHRFTPKAYGCDLDTDCPEWFLSPHKEAVRQMALQVMVCDFFDAVTTRRNSGSLISDPKDLVAVANCMDHHFPAYKSRINYLLECKERDAEALVLASELVNPIR